MKRNLFTLTEMLIVIAVVLVLAGILIPTLMYARSRARLTDCANNQSQVVKLIIATLAKNNNKLVSAPSGDKLWSKVLIDAGILPSLESARCTEMK